ncbi:Germin-like protein 9-3 [Cocos nucifera]|nr:Germin-like protein 9-3 [Cocos nucifera]
MALNALSNVLFYLPFAFATSHVTFAGDPDITSDFALPPNTTVVDGSSFTFTGMRRAMTPDPPKAFTVFKATMAEFPALNGQSVSYAILMFPAGSVSPPHTHPRAAELLFLVEGFLEVGFVDTTNKLYTQRLQPGDMFVFPKGLVHYQYCFGQSPAAAISAFGSASAGTVSVPGTVFTSGIDDDMLAKSFKTDVATIQMIKSGPASKA